MVVVLFWMLYLCLVCLWFDNLFDGVMLYDVMNVMCDMMLLCWLFVICYV